MKKKIYKIIVIIQLVVIISLTGYIIYEKSNNKEITPDNTIKNLLNKEEIAKYKNYTGEYGDQKTIISNEKYMTKLSLDGKVRVCSNVTKCENITNLSNVVDVIEWQVAGPEESQKVLFLVDNGDLYSYSYEDYNNNKYTATKIKELKNIRRIVNFSYASKANAGGCWGALAIDKENNYKEVFRECV